MENQPDETPVSEVKPPSNKLWKIIKTCLPFVVAVTFICGLIYIVGQQIYRQSANDPQIQMAEDAAAALSGGQTPGAIIGNSKVDIAISLSPYLIIFDSAGQPIASSAKLDDKTPTIPKGAFDYTKKHGQDRITWQPKAGIRQAVIIVHYEGQNSGFVLAGRSMREIETREGQLLSISIICWLIALFSTLVIIVGLEFLKEL
jgi:hypothetical protein